MFKRIKAAWSAFRHPDVVEQPPAPVEDPGIPDENIPHVTGFPGGRIISTQDPKEVRRVLEEAAAEGRRVSFNVRDKNGWHQFYQNKPSPGRHKPKPGITASELLKKFERDGIPGEEKE